MHVSRLERQALVKARLRGTNGLLARRKLHRREYHGETKTRRRQKNPLEND